ncbi:RluA family pseudouridine synthase [Methylibium sp.]|uniref:RluA family pseudouridine synthase n=1 Tax=Methylibium sp. TaxID=2067992 RepID=UPI003D0D8199
MNPPARSAPADAPRVVYRDEHLLVVDKPPGLLAVPGRGTLKQDCLAARLQALWADTLVVHRLDQATSGLMVFARSPAVQRCLSMAFERREVIKRYVAVVWGRVEAPQGCIDLPLRADWPNRPRQQVDREQGKPSCTRWHVLSHHAAGETTRLELEPQTGRTHQLRVHLWAIGHPIVGDTLYGAAEQMPATRLLLHASELAFAHPVSGAPLHFALAAPF